MELDRQKAMQAFKSYVAPYDVTNEKIRLKIEHTYKVAMLCERIGKTIGLNEEDVDIAWFTGLLHDVGRFEQLRVYNTFMDAESVDHAKLGAEILFSQGKIREFCEDASQDEMLEIVIANHSAYRIPENLPERTEMFCNILRDADKIDILRVNTESPLEEIYNTTVYELKHSEVTEEVMDSLREHHAVLRKLKKTPIDHLAGHVSLYFELVYPCSYEIVKEQGFLDKILAFQSENARTREQFKEMKEIVACY